MSLAAGDTRISKALAGARPDDEVLLHKLANDPDLVNEYDQEQEKYPQPDQGYAWVILPAGFLMAITTWGSTTCFGVYISYWLNNDTFAGADPLNYALSSSITICLAQAAAPIAMIMYRMIGYKWTAALGAALHFLGFMLGSFCTELWQLYCTQGLLIGMGFVLIFSPTMLILPSWFQKYRALGSGGVIAGSGVGGCVFALASQRLIDTKDDYRWGFRMIAFVTVALNIIVVTLIKERIPQKKIKGWAAFKRELASIMDIKTLKHWYVIAISLWAALAIVAYTVMVYSLAAFCTFIGLSATTGSNVTAVFNGCQAIGRPIVGILGDKYGRINVGLTFNIIVLILVFAFFINCTNFITILMYAILSGLTTGFCQALNQAILPDAVPMEDYPSTWSYENIIIGCFCLVAEVIALKLRDMSAAKPFLKAELFTGFMVLGAFLFLLPVRELKVRRKIEERLKLCEEAKTVPTARIEKYSLLLRKGIRSYIWRLFYPIKV